MDEPGKYKVPLSLCPPYLPRKTEINFLPITNFEDEYIHFPIGLSLIRS